MKDIPDVKEMEELLLSIANEVFPLVEWTSRSQLDEEGKWMVSQVYGVHHGLFRFSVNRNRNLSISKDVRSSINSNVSFLTRESIIETILYIQEQYALYPLNNQLTDSI